MSKPKGGRGKKAPYETKLMRVPEPIASQVEALCQCYQNFLVSGGDPNAPPCFLLERIEVAAAECPTTDSQSAQPIVLGDNPPEPEPAETAPEPELIAPADAEKLREIATVWWDEYYPAQLQTLITQMYGWNAPGTLYEAATITAWLASEDAIVRERISELMELRLEG
ncbi:hypothetical protein QUA41_28585 [Microcoleus sp. Pol11C1]|uniref:hypothetical protein n=1 Tax=unclassified Microcoleus TaxID=2642155 RepID=UPI002FD5655B